MTLLGGTLRSFRGIRGEMVARWFRVHPQFPPPFLVWPSFAPSPPRRHSLSRAPQPRCVCLFRRRPVMTITIFVAGERRRQYCYALRVARRRRLICYDGGRAEFFNGGAALGGDARNEATARAASAALGRRWRRVGCVCLSRPSVYLSRPPSPVCPYKNGPAT